jgi:hypothetical protein
LICRAEGADYSLRFCYRISHIREFYKKNYLSAAAYIPKALPPGAPNAAAPDAAAPDAAAPDDAATSLTIVAYEYIL